MGRLSTATLTFAAAALATVALAACGSSGAELLPGRTANEIEANLDSVAKLAAEHECVGAQNTAQAVSTQIEELGDVDKKLKQALTEGAERLNEVVGRCEEEEAVEESTEPVETSEEPEATKKHEKAGQGEKLEKEQEAEEEEPAETTTPPPQSKGEGKGSENGSGNAPPAETGGGSPSGGVGPGVPAGGE